MFHGWITYIISLKPMVTWAPILRNPTRPSAMTQVRGQTPRAPKPDAWTSSVKILVIYAEIYVCIYTYIYIYWWIWAEGMEVKPTRFDFELEPGVKVRSSCPSTGCLVGKFEHVVSFPQVWDIHFSMWGWPHVTLKPWLWGKKKRNPAQQTSRDSKNGIPKRTTPLVMFYINKYLHHLHQEGGL